METETKSIIKSKWFPWVVGGVAVVIIFFLSFTIGRGVGYSQGHADEKARIDGKMVNYEQLVSKIKDTQKEYDDKTDKLNQLRSDFTGQENKYNELKDLQSKEEDMKTYVTASQAKYDSLKGQIKDAEGTLAKLQGSIVKAEGAPIKLEAGQFVVGKDLPPGRYKASPIGGGSNFAVYSAEGDLKVNTILGDPDSPTYVFEAVDGDQIENDARAQLTPIK